MAKKRPLSEESIEMIRFFRDLCVKDPRAMNRIFARHGVSPEEGVEELMEEILLDGKSIFKRVWKNNDGFGYLNVVQDAAEKLGITECADNLKDVEAQVLMVIPNLHKVVPMNLNAIFWTEDAARNLGLGYAKTVPTVIELALLREVYG